MTEAARQIDPLERFPLEQQPLAREFIIRLERVPEVNRIFGASKPGILSMIAELSVDNEDIFDRVSDAEWGIERLYNHTGVTLRIDAYSSQIDGEADAVLSHLRNRGFTPEVIYERLQEKV